MALHPVMPARNTLCQSFDFSSLTKHSQIPSLRSIQKILVDVLESVEEVEVQEIATTQDSDCPPLSKLLIRSNCYPPPVLVKTLQNTWSRSARRQRRVKSTIEVASASVLTVSEMTCSIHWINIVSLNSAERGQGKSSEYPSSLCSSATLEFQWVYGRERGAFDTFFSHVARKVRISLGFGNK